MKTATQVKTISVPNGNAALYKLQPPLEIVTDYCELVRYGHLIANAFEHSLNGPTTLLMPASETGYVGALTAIDGAIQHCMSHAIALRAVGYEITTEEMQ